MTGSCRNYEFCFRGTPVSIVPGIICIGIYLLGSWDELGYLNPTPPPLTFVLCFFFIDADR